MAVEFISAVLKNSRSTGLDKFVLVCLANFADEHGIAYPSVKTLADRCGIAESSVHKSLKSLMAIGEIELFEAGGSINGVKMPPKKVSNKYQLRIPKDPYVRESSKRIPKIHPENTLENTGAQHVPVPDTYRSDLRTGTQGKPVRNTVQTGTQDVPVPVRTTDPIRHNDPSVNRQTEPPLSPKGEDFFSKEPEKATPKNSEAVEALRLRMGSWFGRKPSTRWSDKEMKALKLVSGTLESELATLEAYYTDKSVQYLRQDILTLLNNFSGEMDRARKHKRAKTGASGKIMRPCDV